MIASMNRVLHEPSVDYNLEVSKKDYANLAEFFSKGKTVLELHWYSVFKAYEKKGGNKPKKLRLVNTIEELQDTCSSLRKFSDNNVSVRIFMERLMELLMELLKDVNRKV